MHKSLFTLFFGLLSAAGLLAQITDPRATEVWEPEPRAVNPGPIGGPPSDAIILFDGADLSQWQHPNSKAASWKLEANTMTVVKGTGDIETRRSFGDCQLHLEFRTPTVIEGEGQGRGNSGIFFQNRYEVQILDSYQNRTYSNGQAGAVYKQYAPLVNPMRAPGEWNAYDIVFTAPRFNNDGQRTSPGYLTVLLNGVLIQNHVLIHGTTEYIGLPKNAAHGPGPIRLQDHGNPVSFRNIWIREL
jgi:hypothetical protein